MKNIVLLLALVFFSQDVSFNDILSKFHQHTFKLKDVRIELMSYNKDYINFFEIKPFKYNRTSTVHNITVNFNVNASRELEVLVQAYKFISNEYRHFPVRFQVNVEKVFWSNAVGFGDIAKCGNFTSICFYKDITYHACNFMLDETRLPPLVPNGKYRPEVTLLLVDKEVAVINIYYEVYTPMVLYRKH